MSAAQPITDQEFDQAVLKSSGPVLVDFWADWCGPCKMLAPILDEVAAALGDKIKIVKINVDENPSTPTKFGIRSIPTLILFKNGEQIGTKVGSLPKAQLQQWIEASV